jgi:hypothetical protein
VVRGLQYVPRIDGQLWRWLHQRIDFQEERNMKRNLFLTALVLVMGLAATAALAQDDGEVTEPVETEPGSGHGICQFVDEDGDGFNDLAPDADGDGIPNGLDPDYVKPEDGEGMQYQWGLSDELFGHFGEGAGEGMGDGNMFQHGPGDGTGETGPNEDGTGFGPGTGTGTGDGPEDGEGTGGGREDRGGQGSGGKQ